jgi:integrase
MDLSLVMFFIDLAKIHTKEIVFGLYLQVCGGLRISEVVSITWGDIEPVGMSGENGFIINLGENRRMRSDLLNYHINTGIKSPRKQVILPFGDLQIDLYRNHKNIYYLKDKSGMNALFVNNKNLPMTNKNYRDRFNKLKKIFLKALIDKSNNDNDINLLAYINKLSTEDWSTHIFRGIYSNIVSSHAKSLIEMMVMRGDRSMDASLPYVQTSETTKEKITEHLSNMYKEFCSNEQFEKLYKISEELNKERKK